GTTSGCLIRLGTVSVHGKPRIANEENDMNSRVPRRTTQRPHYGRILVAGVGLFLGAHVAAGQAPVDTTPRLTISGFGQADFIVDFKRNDPLWFDVNRPSRLPSGPDQFGANGNTYVS